MKTVERAAYSVGGQLGMSGGIHGVVLLTGAAAWAGPMSAAQPRHFVFLRPDVDECHVHRLVRPLEVDRGRAPRSLMRQAASLETLLVSLRAWRGVPVAFRRRNVVRRSGGARAGVGGFTIAAITVVLTVAAFRDETGLWQPFRRRFGPDTWPATPPRSPSAS